MSKHVQLLSVILHMKAFLKSDSHSNLTDSSAGFTRLEAAPKNDVTYS